MSPTVIQEGGLFALYLGGVIGANFYTQPYDFAPTISGEQVLEGRALVCERPAECCIYLWVYENGLPMPCGGDATWRVTQRRDSDIVLRWSDELEPPVHVWWWGPGDAPKYEIGVDVWAGPADWNVDGTVDVFDLISYLADWGANGTIDELLTFLSWWF